MNLWIHIYIYIYILQYILIYYICGYLVHLVREIYDISTTTLHAMELGSPRPAGFGKVSIGLPWRSWGKTRWTWNPVNQSLMIYTRVCFQPYFTKHNVSHGLPLQVDGSKLVPNQLNHVMYWKSGPRYKLTHLSRFVAVFMGIWNPEHQHCLSFGPNLAWLIIKETIIDRA